MSKNSDEVFTPPELFSCLRIKFDLDPCAPVEGGDYVPAKSKYTLVDDGLVKPWFGRVWLNPPYSKPGPWVERLIAHNNGVALVPVSTGAKWFAHLWSSPAAISYAPKTISFIKAGQRHGIFMPLVLAGFGPVCQRAVGRFGTTRVTTNGPTRTAKKAGRCKAA